MPPISRRRFLLATLGVGVVGSTLGVRELLDHPGGLYRLGIEKSPDFLVPDGHVQTQAGSITSRFASKEVQWRLSLPEGGALATVFCLHGKGGNHSQSFDDLRLHDMVAEFGLPLAVVGVDGGDHSYWHKRADGTDYGAMLIEELMPTIEAITGTTKRALYGWSMGGYGALLANKTHPQMFDAVVALSPALWTKSGHSAPGAFDNADDFRIHDVFVGRDQLDTSNIRISCGTGDPFYAATKAFAASLRNAQIDFGEGFHDSAYWRSVSPAALQFITQKVDLQVSVGCIGSVITSPQWSPAPASWVCRHRAGSECGSAQSCGIQSRFF